MIPDYIKDIGRVDDICGEFRRYLRKQFFTDSNSSYQDYTTKYHWPYLPSSRVYLLHLSRLIEICDLFGIVELESAKNELQRKIHMLEEERDETKNWKSLDVLIQDIERPFSNIKTKLNEIQTRLEPKEKERLNEALHVYMEGAYYSSVAMSVSTIEHRLLSLMKNAKETTELDEMTLGALIREYLKHEKDDYKSLSLSRHRPLLELCNNYRIFSVHPKDEAINRKVATSVLNLTLEFLLDEKTVIKKSVEVKND